MNTEFRVVTGHAPGDRAKLVADVYADNRKWLYTVSLLDLFGNELDLRGGRFAHYHASMDLPHRATMAKVSQGERDLVRWLSGAVEWCAGQKSIWSFGLDMPHLHAPQFVFAFEDQTTAVAFVLVFS
jgi:hypothetical protein